MMMRLKRRDKKEEEDGPDESGYGVISCMMCYTIIQQHRLFRFSPSKITIRSGCPQQRPTTGNNIA